MFYVNNEQVKGIFLNGRNYNYLSYGFGKIIPEDRNVYQLNLNLAYKFLNQYRIEFGSIKDGYENALVSPRFDEPDSNGIFHTPFTYYYNGDIISTKEVPVLITNGEYALSNALVYNDMNINGAINYFAENTDFQGHNVNTYLEGFGSSQPYFDSTVMSNCSNFHLRSLSRFGKGSQPTLYNCNNFSGWFNFVRDDDGTRYPRFRGFLEDCKDGVFNINCTNMHGGGNATNCYDFSGIQGCNNIKLNITGSSWQVWPHDHSFSSNCNINTYNVISGFSYMNYCNFNVVLPKDSKPEMTSGFEFLNNAENCNYNLYATDVNLFNYRSGVGHAAFFDGLNNCKLNLQVNNAVSFDHTFGNNLSNCKIVFDNIKADLSAFIGWNHLNNCNISGNVVSSYSAGQAFIYDSNNINIQLNFAGTNIINALSFCNNVVGNIKWLGKDAAITYSNGIRLSNVNNGSIIFNNVYNSNIFRVYNATTKFRSVNNMNAVARSGAYVSILDNCHDLRIYYFNIVGGTLIQNVYNSSLYFNSGSRREFMTKRIDNCSISGFPYGASYTNNCRFDVGLEEAASLHPYITWNNVWPHGFRMSSGSNKYLAGLRSIDTFMTNCTISSADMVFGGSTTFNNVNNMQTNITTFYNGIVTANLPIYSMNIKLNVDCATLNLGIMENQAFPGMPSGLPAHGFQNATISANNIYARLLGTINDSCVQVNCDTKIYCENYCDVCFRPYVANYSSVLQPVILINNYDHANYGNQYFFGGLTRIGSLSTRTGPRRLLLYAGACVFINNAVLNGAIVDNSLLFLGSNVIWTNGANVTNGGLIVNRSKWPGSGALSLITRSSFAWNIWDSGPWGSQSLFDYCLNV